MAPSQKSLDALTALMDKLQIREEDLVEKFVLGSGSGGQKINKTSSCVYLKHIPSGIEVKCQQDRSREMNRFLARRALCKKIEAIQTQEKTEEEREIAKLRRQKKRRKRKTRAKLAHKREQVSVREQFRDFRSGDG